MIYIPAAKPQANFKPDYPVELDPDNVYGARAALYIQYGASGSLDLARHRVGVPVGGITPATIGEQGRTKAWAGATSEYYVRDSVMEFPVGTWAAYVRRTGTLPSYARPFGKTNTNGTAAPYVSWDFEYNPGGAGQNVVQASSDISGTATHTSQATFTDTTIPHLVIGTYDGATLKLYQNTALMASVAVSGALAYDTSSSGNLIVSGSSSSGVANEWFGDIYWLAAWPWAFTQADVNSINANPNQVVRARQRDLFFAVSNSAANNLSGASAQQQSASSTLSQTINLTAASVQQAAASGVMNVGIPLTGSATAQQQANGNIQITVPLDGASIQQQAGSGSMTINVTLNGQAIQQAAAAATLTNTASGTVALVGESDQQQVAQGVLNIGVNASGASLAVQSAQGNLTTLVPLSGVSVQATQASGGLNIAVTLDGSALQQQSAIASMSMRVSISAQSIQQAAALGYLSTHGILTPNPNFAINAVGRKFAINAVGRRFTI